MTILHVGGVVGAAILLMGCVSEPQTADRGTQQSNTDVSKPLDKQPLASATAFHATLSPQSGGGTMIPAHRISEVAVVSNRPPTGSHRGSPTHHPYRDDSHPINWPSTVAYVSNEPFLTSVDFTKSRIRPEDDRFVIEIDVANSACERLASAAQLGESDRKRMLASVQGLALVRNGRLDSTYSIEDLVTNSTLRITTYSREEAEAIRDLLVAPKNRSR